MLTVEVTNAIVIFGIKVFSHFHINGKMLQSGWTFISFLFFCGYLGTVTACSEHAVKKALFDGYDRELRPVKNQSTVTNLYVQSNIYNILSVNGQNEILELLIWSNLNWTDEFLQWNPIDFDGCENFTTLASSVWIPDYYFLQMLEIIDIGMEDHWFVQVHNDGTITTVLPMHITLYCKMDIADFPFDTQTCNFTAGSSVYSAGGIMALRTEDGPPERVERNNSEFDTVSFFCQESLLGGGNGLLYSVLEYSLVLKRRPEYYIFVLLLPSFLLTMLCIIGIFTPNTTAGERNEKMTLGLTTLLSMAVILNITADAMPKSGSGLPLLGNYVLVEIGVCSLSTIFSTVLICIHERANRKNWEPPTIIRWIASIPSPFGCLKWIVGSGDQINASKSSDNTSTSKVHPLRRDENVTLTLENSSNKSNARVEQNEMLTVLRQINAKLDEYLKSCDEEEERRVIWASAFNHIDIFLLVIFFIANCVLTATTMF